MKAYFRTFGCKVSTAETDSIALLLHRHGWEDATSPEEADAILVNSCTVTASGDQRMLTELRRLRRKAPQAVIVLTGCYVQAFPDAAARIPEADIVTGVRGRSDIPALLAAYFTHPHRMNRIESFTPGERFEELPQGTDAGHTRAFLKIQDGCDRFCAYCIIPYARGRCRSRSPESIVQEAGRLTKQGFCEIVLCGINLACWGQEQGLTIADAVRIASDAGVRRIRLGSMEPDGLTEGVLRQLAGIPELCPHFHISVQSGCDRTLRAMHRSYTCAAYAALLGRLRSLFPGCAVTTDIMVGFPGETEADFAETLRFAEKMAFAQMHVFRYSPRPGTPAAELPEQVPESVKKERADLLTALAARMRTAYLRGCIGQETEVLFERPKYEGFRHGHAGNHAIVCVPGTEDLRGTLRRVRITAEEDGRLYGVLL